MKELTDSQRIAVTAMGNAIASVKHIGLRTDYAIKPVAWESSVGWIRRVGKSNWQVADTGEPYELRQYLEAGEHYREMREARAFAKLQTALQLMERHGLSYLGSGYFGAAFINEITDKVIKIAASGTGDGWIPFIQWAMQHHDKYPLHLPEIYEFHKNDSFVYAIMDLMEDSCEGTLNASYMIQAGTDQQDYICNLGSNIECHHGDYLRPKVPESFYDCVVALWQAFDVGDCHSGNFMIHKGNLVIIDPIAWTNTAAWNSELGS